MSVNLHLYPSPFITESRILRITKTLASAGVFDRIYIAATYQEGLEEEEALDDVRTVLRIRTWVDPDRWRALRYVALVEWALRIWLKLRHERLTAVNPHSVPALPIACLFRKLHGATVIYDTHEIETEQYDRPGITRTVSKTLERLCIRYVDHLIATSDGHAAWYVQAYDLNSFSVVKNYSRKRNDSELRRDDTFRRELGVGPDELIFIYLGLMSPGRGIELILEAFGSGRTGSHVVFMGFGPLTERVRQAAAQHANIHCRDAVPPDQVYRRVRGCDVGLCIIEPTCLSYHYTLPNKMLECLNVGVPVIVSDFPDMRAAVAEHDCGWAVEPSPESVTKLVCSIDARAIAQKRSGAMDWAREHTWESQEVILLDAYAELLGRTGRNSHQQVL